jgi:hypothetical protein
MGSYSTQKPELAINVDSKIEGVDRLRLENLTKSRVSMNV